MARLQPLLTVLTSYLLHLLGQRIQRPIPLPSAPPPPLTPFVLSLFPWPSNPVWGRRTSRGTGKDLPGTSAGQV